MEGEISGLATRESGSVVAGRRRRQGTGQGGVGGHPHQSTTTTPTRAGRGARSVLEPGSGSTPEKYPVKRTTRPSVAGSVVWVFFFSCQAVGGLCLDESRVENGDRRVAWRKAMCWPRLQMTMKGKEVEREREREREDKTNEFYRSSFLFLLARRGGS